MSSTQDLRLINLFLEGSLADEQLQELEKRLLEDEEFAQQLAYWSLTHRQVRELSLERKLHHLMEQTSEGTALLPRAWSDDFSRRKVTKDRSSGFPGARLLVSSATWLSLAGVVLLTLGVVWWNDSLKESTEDKESTVALSLEPPQTVEMNQIAATLSRLDDCVWEEPSAAYEQGEQITAGSRIVLQEGVLKLTFECGAEVVLEGPCDFLVESPMLGFLEAGKLTANVPRRAFTFAIQAPGIDFVDLGTDFGISVDDQGDSELHVFDGEVLYRQDTKERKSSEVVHVTENKAVRFAPLPEQPSHIAVDRHQFARHFDLRQGKLPAADLPVSEKLALWLNAAGGVDTDDQGRVVAWHDQIVGDNKVAEDALQSNENERPRLLAKGMSNQPAVRFDGQNDYLLTTPLETTDNQTVLIVCQFSPAAFSEDRIYGGQILNYDGPPTRELSNTLAPGILQIGEPLLKEEFAPSLVTGQVFAGFIGKMTVEAGRVDGEQVGPETPIILSYRYDYQGRKADLFVNGKKYPPANAFAPAGLTSRKVIGRHAWMELFFHGDLAEILIYNQALATQELSAVQDYLAKKYRITHGESAAIADRRGRIVRTLTEHF